MKLSELEAYLIDSALKQGMQFHVSVPGFDIPIALRILSVPPSGVHFKTLIFTFHGTVDRTKRKAPVFEGRFLTQEQQALKHSLIVGFADPILEAYDNLRTSWFAGGEILNTPELLRILIGTFVKALNPERTIFVGVSTGGHPAIRQSSYFPGSICVVSNPICFISKYYIGHVDEYKSLCWPKLKLSDPLPDSCMDKVSTIFGNNFQSTLIYLNNARDHHFWLQATRFLYSVTEALSRNRILFVSNYYDGYSGHGTPPSYLARWVSAACNSASISIDDVGAVASILHDFSKNKDDSLLNIRHPLELQKSLMSVDAHDYRLSGVLRDYHLRQTLEN
jgi:hypothetical protein